MEMPMDLMGVVEFTDVAKKVFLLLSKRSGVKSLGAGPKDSQH